MPEQELYHYGVKGMKWGVRRANTAKQRRNARKTNKGNKNMKGMKNFNMFDTTITTRGAYSRKAYRKLKKKPIEKWTKDDHETNIRHGRAYTDALIGNVASLPVMGLMML